MLECQVKLQVMNPRGKTSQVVKKPISPRLETLESKKIGVINNTKSGGQILWPYVEADLKKRYPGIEFQSWRIGFAFLQERKEPLLREVADYADAVVGHMGD